MGRVAREMVEQAGLDVGVLLEKFAVAAGAEFTTFYYYTILVRPYLPPPGQSDGRRCPLERRGRLPAPPLHLRSRTGQNCFPRQVFPAEKARQVKGIGVFEVREEDGWGLVGQRQKPWES